MSPVLEHEPTTAEQERTQTVGLAAVPGQTHDEQPLEHDNTTLDLGDGGPPNPPHTPRRTLPHQPKRWARALVLYLLLLVYIGAVWLLIAGFDEKLRRYTTGNHD